MSYGQILKIIHGNYPRIINGVQRMRNTTRETMRRQDLIYLTNPKWSVNRSLDEWDLNEFNYIYDILLRIVDTKTIKIDAIRSMFRYLYITHTNLTFYTAEHNYRQRLVPQLEFDQLLLDDYFDTLAIVKQAGETI